MSPMLVDALGSILRFLLAGVFGYLVEKGVWTGEQSATFLSAAVVGILALGWSLWNKYKSRIKLVTALASQPSTEAQIEKMVSSGDAPSVHTAKTAIPSTFSANITK
jgi:hypothetical protein